tara:strand:+ start:28345 stop:28929 length:585 start_codon:yes stop_codon:yes gene_type:complete
MAVFFYGEGEHPAGFIGYRVATTLGNAKEYRQEYFALSEYSPSKASKLAHKLDKLWRDDAISEIRNNLLTTKRANAGAGYIVQGFRASLRVGRGRKPEHRTYITPSFIVTIPGYGKGQKEFSIRKLGFDYAYQEAVNFYSKLHNLTIAETSLLMKLKPNQKLFTFTLRLDLLKKGTIVTEAYIKNILKLQNVVK